MNRRSVGIVCFGLLVALALTGCKSRSAPPIDRGDTPTATSTLEQTQGVSDLAQIFYRSQAYHLKVALPPGWTAAEGPTYLARPFTGLVAFNSWGEPGFWVPELRTATGATYGPDSVTKQIPTQGAYVVLVHFSGGPPMPAEQYGPEYEQQDLGGVWDQTDCRRGGIRAGVTWSDFFKWGRRLRLEVYCDPNASDATAKAVNALLTSWRFDQVPAGDVGWAIVQARPLLPAAVEPARFPLALGQAGGVSQTMAQDGVVARITQAEVQGQTVVITFKYRWNEPQLGAGSGSDDCPPHRCHWWRFEARPSGEVVPVGQGGAELDLDAGGESSKPEPSEQAQRIPSPDERWIAVLDKTAGSLDLHSAGGATWAVFPPGSTVSTAGWSPDSQQLIVVRTNWVPPQPGVEAQTIGPIEIWRIRVDDQAGEPELVFQSSDWPNASGGLAPEAIELGPWSPDNRHVLFWHSPLSASALADGATLRVLDTQTNQITPLGKALLSQRYHSWAPDSSALAITLGGYRSAQVNKWLSLFDVKSGQVTTLVSKTEQIPGIVAWSPRSDLIAYAAVPAEETGEDLADWMVFDNPAIAGRRVYLLDPRSGEHWRLNDAAAFQDAPTWSDDGAVLYYVQREGDTMTLMAADPAAGQAQGVQGAQLPAPEAVGYYGRAEWEDLLAYRPASSPTPIPAPTPTATRAAEKPTATPVLVDLDPETRSFASPDGEWVAQTVVAFPVKDGVSIGESYYTQLKLSKADGTREWTVIDEWSPFGLGYTIPQPFHWSQDGRFLYVTNKPVPDGCGVFVNGSDLHRVDLSDGSVTQIVPSSGLWLSFSPDESTLAYIGYGGRGLVLRDLTTGAERETKLNPGEDYAAGQIVWSPDGAALVLTLAIRPCSVKWAESVSVVRVEAATLEQTTLIQRDERLFITMEWPFPDRILLRDDNKDLWWMDAVTGQVIKKD